MCNFCCNFAFRNKRNITGTMKNKKPLYPSLIILSSIVFILIVAFCILFNTLGEWAPPVKPEKVPKEAVWAGGVDGGCFFLLQSELSDTSHFTIYNDFTGDIWYNGYFYCDKNDFERISKMDWYELVECYNGLYLFMKDPDDGKREIVWRKVMPENIPNQNEVFWVDGNNEGWFFDIQSAYEDTSHFVIYEGLTGDVLHNGLFFCNKNDFEHIDGMDWYNLLKCYDGYHILMYNPNDTSKLIVWYPIE